MHNMRVNLVAVCSIKRKSDFWIMHPRIDLKTIRPSEKVTIRSPVPCYCLIALGSAGPQEQHSHFGVAPVNYF